MLNDRYLYSHRTTIVLCRPADIRNIGAAIRAAANFSLKKVLIITDQSLDHEALVQFSSRACERIPYEISNDFLGAMAGFSQILGTTRRDRDEFSPSYFSSVGLTHHLMPEGELAILFGNEKFGLSKEELSICSASVCIPTHPDFPSMNLGQAVAVIAYELSRPELNQIAKINQNQTMPQALKSSPKAQHAFYENIIAILDQISYPPGRTAMHFTDRLKSILNRANLEDAEFSFLMGIFKELKRTSLLSKSLQSKQAQESDKAQE
jgi:TrmH family RNA methyltransferase